MKREKLNFMNSCLANARKIQNMATTTDIMRPPRYEDVEGMARDYIAAGSILFTDGAKAYAKIAKEEG